MSGPLSTSKVLAILAEHSIVATAASGRVWAVTHWTQREADGSITEGQHSELVPMTVPELRDWLGY